MYRIISLFPATDRASCSLQMDFVTIMPQKSNHGKINKKSGKSKYTPLIMNSLQKGCSGQTGRHLQTERY
jgi:hypothetical protein